jgi:hypothetical protein
MLAPIAAGTGFITLFLLLGFPMLALEGGFRMLGFGLITLWLVIGKVCWMIGLGALLLSRFGQEPGTREGGQWIPAAGPGPGSSVGGSGAHVPGAVPANPSTLP